MKIEKISDSFVNEFDAQTQGCLNDCLILHASTTDKINDTMYCRSSRGYNNEDQKAVNALEGVGNYCYESRTPERNIYW
ncbi:MAG: hypothetical protein K6F97_00855 [Lachnospiraceae bacterium]|nr:hypothetical protein [Lachnospiraceae bacterium]